MFIRDRQKQKLTTIFSENLPPVSEEISRRVLKEIS